MTRRTIEYLLLSAVVLVVALAAGFADINAVPGDPLPPRPELPAPQDRQPVILEFSGPVDGSERIEIDPSGAVWHHLHRGLPSAPMSVNNVTWDPRVNAVLANRGESRFLDRAVDFSHARLEIIEGRDLVAMTKTKDRIALYLNDTPNGEGQYKFRIVFEPEPPRATLRVRARIDGSDVLHITKGEARWEHKHWSWPGRVSLNGVEWGPQANATLPNEGETQFLPEEVDFSTARVIHQTGRDLPLVVPQADGLTVYFGDNPNGADDYELLISFGP